MDNYGYVFGYLVLENENNFSMVNYQAQVE
jgi:hypothetical protein